MKHLRIKRSFLWTEAPSYKNEVLSHRRRKFLLFLLMLHGLCNDDDPTNVQCMVMNAKDDVMMRKCMPKIENSYGYTPRLCMLEAFVFRRSSKTRLTCFPSIIYCYRNLGLWDEGARGMKGAVWKKDESILKLWMKKLRLSAKTVIENETDLKGKRLLSPR
jgi:hypothetical protein